MKSYEFQARTVEKAIEKGLAELGKSKFDVDIKILESGGLFKKAKVQISFDDKDEFSLDNLFGEEKSEKPQEAEKVEEPIKEQETQTHECKETEEPTEEVLEETLVHLEVEPENLDSEEREETPEVQEKPKRERVYTNNKGSKEFIEGLLSHMGVSGTVEIEEQEEHSKAVISTEQAGAVIGYRGECLSAIQYLSNIFGGSQGAQKINEALIDIIEQKKNKTAKRLIVDVADYRERRDDSIKDMADRMARKVLKMRKSIKLKPMNAYERRIIHSYLQKFDGVTTHSVGVEPHRCLIIDIKRD